MHAVATRRRPVIRGVAIALFGLVCATGCTMVGNSLTGVSFSRQTVGTCIQRCTNDAAAAIDLEQKTHQQSIDQCQVLSGDEQGACLGAEGARHQAAIDAIQEARKGCLGDCHHQGEGSSN